MTNEDARALLRGALDAAIARVNGREAVRAALRANAEAARATHVFAVGKAAASMMLGARDVMGDGFASALLITKHGHLEAELSGDRRITELEASHPVPDGDSLAAGNALLEFVSGAPEDARFVALISGGASALVDVLAPGVGADELARFNVWMLASGFDIHQINRLRKCASRIKGGRLAAALEGRRADVLMISDVTGDDPRSIGSGLLISHDAADLDVAGIDIPETIAPLLGYPAPLPDASAFANVHPVVIACPADARGAAAAYLRAAGVRAVEHEGLIDGDAVLCGKRLANESIAAANASTEPTAWLWAGETTVILPPSPGRGGRSQALALSAAEVIAGNNSLVFLAAGTDGTDGPGQDAGGLVDGGTVSRAHVAALDTAGALAAADSGSVLDVTGDLVTTGPTGTNVMDLVIALKN